MAKIKKDYKDAESMPAIITERETDIYLNNEVKHYALYVVTTRALPNIIDGLRVGARKILYAAMTGKLKKGSKEKMPVLIGNAMELEFLHGDSSLKNTIEQLGAKHLFEYSPLDIIGQTGSLRVPEASTAARYLKVTKNKNIELYDFDMDILRYNFEDGKYTEPKYFLPIIPMVLLWRTNSPGFGFSFRSFSHDINDIIDATITSLTQGSCNGLFHIPIRPSILGISEDNIIFNESKQTYYNVGEYQIDGDILIITDLPFNVSYSKYEKHLIELKEQNYIFDFRNQSKKGAIKYIITFPKGKINLLMKESWKFFTKMKLFSKIPNLTLNTIDIDGKTIVNFETTQDLVDGFVKRRLRFYNERKTLLVDTIEKRIVDLTDKAKFIQLVLDGKLVINKRKVEDVKKDCDTLGVTYEGLKLITLRFTEEEINKAINEIVNLKSELEYINNTSIEQMYLNDLIELKSKVSDIKKINIL